MRFNLHLRKITVSPLDTFQAVTLNKVHGVSVVTNHGMSRQNIVNEAVLSRRFKLLKDMLDPRRDTDHECGIPKTVTDEMLCLFYERSGIATKVNDIWPTHCWKVSPDVMSIKEKGTETETDFDVAWRSLHNINDLDIDDQDEDASIYAGEKGSPIWESLKQVDIDSGVGELGYAVLVLGFDDGGSLDQPLEKAKAKSLLYMDSYKSSEAKITKIETDSTNKRYNLPTEYTITQESFGTNGTRHTKDVAVHYTRVIHVTNKGLKTISCSRLLKTYNLLFGLNKITGAAPEGYWKMAFTKLLLESQPGAMKDDFDLEALAEEADKFENSLNSVMSLFGMSGKAISPKVTDPNPFISSLVDLICASEDIPKRIFMGSERGELGSSQDKQEWNERLEERQQRHITPRIIVRFVKRLIWAGVLPSPGEDGFDVTWPNLNELDETTSAEVSLKRVQTMSAYIQSGLAETLISPTDFLVREMNMTEEEAKEVSQNLTDYVADLPDEPDEDLDLDETNEEEDGNSGSPTDEDA